ncbi:C-type mannose receptor 2-like [Eleginops maclovinus]|uniref:C-type mannose receptor 2-like n=1 Tax=Eleginops maclovinus TaxID=56733 RepID=UPI003080FADD
MDLVPLLFMAAAGLCAATSHAKYIRRYTFVYTPKNMTEAQKYCREKYTDLATVDSEKIVKILNDAADLDRMVYPGYHHRAWIGLYDDVDSWRWSLSNSSFYHTGETGYRQWKIGSPNNCLSREHCTQMNGSGDWDDIDCGESVKAVCMDVKGLNVTFVLVHILMNWTEAQSYCRAHHTDLASVRNMAENQQVKMLVPASTLVWIGLFRDSWKWSDGKKYSFSHWVASEPNNNGNEMCVAAHFASSGRWQDWPCGDERHFICYKLIKVVSKQVIKVRLHNKNSGLNPNDETVQNDLLGKIKQKLWAKGLDKNIRLSSRKQSDGKVFHKEQKKDEL